MAVAVQTQTAALLRDVVMSGAGSDDVVSVQRRACASALIRKFRTHSRALKQSAAQILSRCDVLGWAGLASCCPLECE